MVTEQAKLIVDKLIELEPLTSVTFDLGDANYSDGYVMGIWTVLFIVKGELLTEVSKQLNERHGVNHTFLTNYVENMNKSNGKIQEQEMREV